MIFGLFVKTLLVNYWRVELCIREQEHTHEYVEKINYLIIQKL